MKKLLMPLFFISISTSLVYLFLYRIYPNSIQYLYNIQVSTAMSLFITLIFFSIQKISNKTLVFMIALKIIFEILLNKFFLKHNCVGPNLNIESVVISNFALLLFQFYFIYVQELAKKNPPPKVSKDESFQKTKDYRMKIYMRIPTKIVGGLLIVAPIDIFFKILGESLNEINLVVVLFVALILLLSFVLGIIFISIGVLGKYPNYIIKFISKYDNHINKAQK